MRLTVVSCDLCLAQFQDDAEFSKLAFKKPGKKTAHKYEICSQCAEKLQQQLVSNTPLEDWGFQPTAGPPIKTPLAVSRRDELQNDDLTDDDLLIQQKILNTQDYNGQAHNLQVLSEEATKPSTPKKAETTKQSECDHANKGKLQASGPKDNLKFYRTCRECNKRITEKRLDERNRLTNVGIGGHDIKLNDHNAEERGGR